MSENLTIGVENARKAYKNTTDDGKELLEHLFGREVFVPVKITERVKTFEDACEVLQEIDEDNKFVREYDFVYNELDCHASPDLIAFLKLRIIAAALNEGWVPNIKEQEERWYPWFWLYTKEEWDNLSEKDKEDGCLLGVIAPNDSFAGFAFSLSNSGISPSYAYYGSRLCFRTEELATYCGKQFVQIWRDFLCK
jgi:hypothetical protein